MGITADQRQMSVRALKEPLRILMRSTCRGRWRNQPGKALTDLRAERMSNCYARPTGAPAGLSVPRRNGLLFCADVILVLLL
jgi:hypothetical protein